MKNLLSAGLAAMPVDSDGVPFNMSHIYASGNIAADMTANVAAESTGRVLATRLFNLTNDRGMKEMLSFLIARDAMHQNQWLAALEELGGAKGVFPIPSSFPQEQENRNLAMPILAFTRMEQPRQPGDGPTGHPLTERVSSSPPDEADGSGTYPRPRTSRQRRPGRTDVMTKRRASPAFFLPLM
jgi:hypothetical protein